MRIFYFLIFISFITCNREKYEKIKIISKDIVEAEADYYVGNIVEVYNNNLYIYGIGRPLVRFNIFSEKLDTLYFSRDKYIYSVKEKDGFVYIITSGILKRINEGLKDIANIGIDGYFKFINDELIIIEDFSSIKDYFSVFNIKNGKKISSFGEMIEYPDIKFKEKLKYDRFTIPYPEFEWDVKGSILIVYEYFYDRLKAYDVFTGRKIKDFGIKHKEWTIPKVEIKGKGKNKTYKIKKTPAAGISISDNYIFIAYEKLWLKEWEIGNYENKFRKLYRKGFFFVDVYRKKDFEYLGTLYPLNDQDFFKDDLYFRVWRIKSEDDSTLTFYLQDNSKETFFRKVKITFKIEEGR